MNVIRAALEALVKEDATRIRVQPVSLSTERASTSTHAFFERIWPASCALCSRCAVRHLPQIHI